MICGRSGSVQQSWNVLVMPVCAAWLLTPKVHAEPVEIGRHRRKHALIRAADAYALRHEDRGQRRNARTGDAEEVDVHGGGVPFLR